MNESVLVEMFADMIMNCAKFANKVIPKIVKQNILVFEKIHTNFVRSENILYRGGIASKQMYISIRSSLTMYLDDTGPG